MKKNGLSKINVWYFKCLKYVFVAEYLCGFEFQILLNMHEKQWKFGEIKYCDLTGNNPMWSICTLHSAVHSIFQLKDWRGDIWQDFSFITLKQIRTFLFDILNSALADSVIFQKNSDLDHRPRQCTLQNL